MKNVYDSLMKASLLAMASGMDDRVMLPKRLIEDVLDELGKNKPQLMTLEEIEKHPKGAPVFYESRIIYPSWVIHADDIGGELHFLGLFGNILADKSECGIRWRCWTNRPSNDQMKAELWK